MFQKSRQISKMTLFYLYHVICIREYSKIANFGVLLVCQTGRKTYFCLSKALKILSFFNSIYLALYLSDYLRIRLCQIPLNTGSTSIKTLEKLDFLEPQLAQNPRKSFLNTGEFHTLRNSWLGLKRLTLWIRNYRFRYWDSGFGFEIEIFEWHIL